MDRLTCLMDNLITTIKDGGAKMADLDLSSPLLDFVLSHAHVETVGGSRQSWTNGYVLKPRSVADYNIIFVRHGEAVWTVDNLDFPLVPGDLLIVPPRAPHRAHGVTQSGLLGSLHVEVTLPGGQDVFALVGPPPVRPVRPGSPLDTYLSGTVAEWEHHDDHAIQIMLPSWSRLVALELLRDDASQGLLHPRPVDPLVAATLATLSARLSEPTSLHDLATATGFSAVHINRLFRKELGITPLQYLARMRMEHAATLLAQGKHSVRTVALSVGFDDPYYFSRQFKNHFRRSPTDYRTVSHPA